MEERQFLVTWSTEVMAEDEIDAAQQVKGILQDPWNQSWFFAVTDMDNETVFRMVDAEDNGAETVTGPYRTDTGVPA